MTEIKLQRIKRKITESRARLMKELPMFSMLLMYLRFVAVKDMKKISTNGNCIFFSPDFFDKLYPPEVDFVLCHQLLHILLGDIWQYGYDHAKTYHHACDIVVNTYLYRFGFTDTRYPHLGNIHRRKTYDDEMPIAKDVYNSFPFTIEALPEREAAKFFCDSEIWWKHAQYSGEDHDIILDPMARFKKDPELEDMAKDKEEEINSQKIPVGNGGDGDGDDGDSNSEKTDKSGEDIEISAVSTGGYLSDNPPKMLLKPASQSEWLMRAAIALQNIPPDPDADEENASYGLFSRMLERNVNVDTQKVLDWVELLEEYVNYAPCDYSLLPPDRRFDSCEFFLPSFSEEEVECSNVLFMVDTSQSFTNQMISEALGEICGAVESFGGRLKGKLGFFDEQVIEVIDFESSQDIKNAIPHGYGGTDFCCIFDHVNKRMKDDDLACVIILTDGFGPFPEESEVKDVPVIWAINNTKVTPPFGKTVRYKVDPMSEKKKLR